LGCCFAAVGLVRTNQLNATFLQTRSQGIAIGGFIVNQALQTTTEHTMLQQGLNQMNFMWRGTVDIHTQRQSLAVDQQHDLRPFAAFGFAYAITPFFAEENVPSAIDSQRSTFPSRSRRWSNRPHAFSHTPQWDQSRCRRQQVVKEGKYFGKSFHRAPVLNIHKMPSTHALVLALGLPPWGIGLGMGKQSLIKSHCSSVSCDTGSILDPAEVGCTSSQDRFFGIVISFRRSPQCNLLANSIN